MQMSMVQVGVMRMPMHYRGVAVNMCMRLAGRFIRSVLVLMMLIVPMTVLML